MATLIKAAMTSTDAAPRDSAQKWMRDASSSPRRVENFTAMAPATVPSNVIGAISSQ